MHSSESLLRNLLLWCGYKRERFIRPISGSGRVCSYQLGPFMDRGEPADGRNPEGSESPGCTPFLCSKDFHRGHQSCLQSLSLGC